METFHAPTMVRSFGCIEGYLCKEVDTTGLLRRTKRHLRYLRIIFSTGKLNVKEDRMYLQMRSFQLKDLISVQTLELPEKGTDLQKYTVEMFDYMHDSKE